MNKIDYALFYIRIISAKFKQGVVEYLSKRMDNVLFIRDQTRNWQIEFDNDSRAELCWALAEWQHCFRISLDFEHVGGASIDRPSG